MHNKILLVDDNEDVIGALSRTLAGYDLVSAGDGASALALVGSEKPDLVLLDIELPGMSGLEVLEKISVMRKRPLVIMITADGTSETTAKALAAGVFSYIIKPFEAKEALEQVKRALAFRAAAEGGDADY